MDLKIIPSRINKFKTQVLYYYLRVIQFLLGKFRSKIS